MPLSWNEIRVRATSFSKDWKDAHYEKGESQSFYNDFFKVFGRRRRDVAVYEEKVKKLNDQTGFIDLFWPGHLLIEQKSVGRSLKNAREQATDYFLALKEEKPRYILLSDFQTFELLDLEDDKEYHFKLSELPDKVKLFDFIAGYHQQKYQDQAPVNIEASELMSNLHKQLEGSGYGGESLERLLVLAMFCLFADDTGIFEPDIFLRYIENHTKEDGSDLGSHLVHLFEVLDTEPDKRQKALDEDLAAFPYVNGELFSGSIRTPSFNTEMRDALLKCCYFNWSKVSPALFGALFQTVMLPVDQRQGGAHYTSERNILKVIKPLFLDELHDEFEKIKSDRGIQRKKKLEKFHEKLANLSFFDPACGCGNFLILSYRELRLLEIEILEELYPVKKSSKVLDIDHLSKIDVDQFYGIEIEEFPARIAEAAMWLVDHQMNMKLSDAFGEVFVRLPLEKSAHIFHTNALTTDWNTFLPACECDYLLGNPPFVGARKKNKSQSKEMTNVFSKVKGSGNLDYVAAWYMLASWYIQKTNIKVAFVSTNSITQGEQTGILWNVLLNTYSIKINFAHRTFKWTIDGKKAKGMKIASVFCVIIGFAVISSKKKYLFLYETLTSEPKRILAKNISPYLIDTNNTLIANRRKPIENIPEISFGNMPNDGGHLLLSDTEKNELLKVDPDAEKYIRTFVSAHEFINGINRWCLWLKDAQPGEIKSSRQVYERIQKVKVERLKSLRKATRELASTPWLFGEIRQPKQEYLLIPKSSSQQRNYIPMAMVKENIIATEALIIANVERYHFGVLTSKMHMEWMRYVSGRIKNDYRYSTIVYNNFPWPRPDCKQREDIENKAQAILDSRGQFPDSTLADLYDPSVMPPALQKAHHALDKVVDQAYRKSVFKHEKERIEFLFELYQSLTEPLTSQASKKKGGRKKAV